MRGRRLTLVLAASASIVSAIAVPAVRAGSGAPPSSTAPQPVSRPDYTVPNDIDKAMAGADGVKGYMIKAENAPTYLASKNRPYVFEPASTIKIVHLLHSVRAVQLGEATYNDEMSVSNKYVGSCPQVPQDWWQDSYTDEEPLWNTLSYMMWASDNARTDAVKLLWTQAAINNTASSAFGTTDTLLKHRLGCNSDAVNSGHNQLTLNDAAKLYEKAFTPGVFDTQRQTELHALMPNNHSQMLAAIAKEFGWLTPTYDQAMAEMFRDETKISFKAGAYDIYESGSMKRYRSIAGWMELPYECHAGDVEYTCAKRFTFGLFIDKATVDASIVDNAYTYGLYEVFRAAVRSAKQSYN